MRVLYVISTGILGGIERHVQCLSRCLTEDRTTGAEVKVLVLGEGGPIASALMADGIDVVAFGAKSGHDLSLFLKFRRLMRGWRPDVVCPQMPMLVPMLYFNLFDRRTPLVRSIHTPTGRESRLVGLVTGLLGRRYDRFLPVSGSTWKEYTAAHPWASGRGEVFFNPLRLAPPKPRTANSPLRVGMIGRIADQKDWGSFAAVAALGGADFVAAGGTREDAATLLGGNAPGLDAVRWEGRKSDGRAWIASLDLFVMTSKHEQLPTVILECFAEGTPVCGFIPEGGLSEILEFSEGPLRDVFIPRRDPAELSLIVRRLVGDVSLRAALAADGRRIAERHFDAEKNCRGRLMEIYREAIAAKKGSVK